MRIAVIIFISLAVVMSRCAPTKTSSSTEDVYEEDISYLRAEEKVQYTETDASNPAAEKLKYADVAPQYDLKTELDSVIKIIKASREDIEFLNGFTVQLYIGPSRDAANEMKEKIYEYSEAYEPEISYIQPNFRVKIGKFFDRLEANKVYVDLKKEFPSAIVVPERIYFE